MKTEIVKIQDVLKAKQDGIFSRAGHILRNGGLVIFPTETVYGLGADATDETAAHKIYTAKGRPSDNPLIVHIKDPMDALQYAMPSALYWRLAERYMPGPLTVIMPVGPRIPKTVTAGLSTVAIRCPVDPIAQALLAAVGVPIAAPSANLSGSPSPTCAAHVLDDMDGRVDMILDGGDCEIGLESTIVKIEDDQTLTLLRPGGITLEMLKKVAPCVRIAEAVLGALPENCKPISPGMKYRHYAPKAPVYLLNGNDKQIESFLMKKAGNFAVLCYQEDLAFFSAHFGEDRCFLLGYKHDHQEQAKRLFYLLREIDKQNFDAIYAPLPPKEGLGMALYNRMIRAAAHQIIDLRKGM